MRIWYSILLLVSLHYLHRNGNYSLGHLLENQICVSSDLLMWMVESLRMVDSAQRTEWEASIYGRRSEDRKERPSVQCRCSSGKERVYELVWCSQTAFHLTLLCKQKKASLQYGHIGSEQEMDLVQLAISLNRSTVGLVSTNHTIQVKWAQ